MTAFLLRHDWWRVALALWVINLLLAVASQDMRFVSVATGFVALSALMVLTEDKT